jgi:hypothetical protein
MPQNGKPEKGGKLWKQRYDHIVNMYKNIFVKIVSSYFRVLLYIQTPVENLPDIRDRSVTGIFSLYI